MSTYDVTDHLVGLLLNEYGTEFRSRILSSRKRGLAPRLAFCSQIFEFCGRLFFFKAAQACIGGSLILLKNNSKHRCNIINDNTNTAATGKSVN